MTKLVLMGVLGAAVSCAGCALGPDEHETATTPHDDEVSRELSAISQSLFLGGCDQEQAHTVRETHNAALRVFASATWRYSQNPWSPQAIRAFGQPFEGSIEYVSTAMDAVASVLFSDQVYYDCDGLAAGCADADALAPGWAGISLCPNFWHLSEPERLALMQHEYMHWILGPTHYAEPVDRSLSIAQQFPYFATRNPTNYVIYNLDL